MHKHMTDIQTNQQCRKGQTHPNRSGKNGNSCKEEQKRKVHRVSRKPKRALTNNFYSGFCRVKRCFIAQKRPNRSKGQIAGDRKKETAADNPGPPWQPEKLEWKKVIQQKTGSQKDTKNERRRYTNGWTIVGIDSRNRINNSLI